MIILNFLILFSIIIFAAVLLSYGAEIFAEKYGANFTGSIVLALITTLPEYMFVIWASLKKEYYVALGSAIGACSLLITLGYGLVIICATTFSYKKVNVIKLSQHVRIDAIYLLLTAIVAFILAYIGNGFSMIDGIILILLFIGYVYQVTLSTKKFQQTTTINISKKKFIISIFILLIGAILIFYFTEPFIDSVIELAKFLNISAVTIAIILAPFASEMPEKITAYITVIRDAKLAEISVCNFLGSKVNHNSLLFGTIPLIGFITAGKNIIPNIINLPFILMTGLTIFITLFLIDRKLTRLEGIIFVLLYILVVTFSFRLH